MLLDLRHKLEIAAGIVVLVGAVIGFRSWLGEHDARIKMDAEVASTKAAIDKLAADRQAEREAEADRDRQRDAANAHTLAEIAKLKTPAQVSGFVNREVPGAGAVVSIPAKAADAKPDAPTPKPVVTLDAAALDLRLGQCKIAETNLSTCEANIAGRDRDAKAADATIKLLTKENGDLQKDLGRTKWQRAWNKYIKPIGALGIGIAAGRLSKR
jgi:hypothetical protein